MAFPKLYYMELEVRMQIILLRNPLLFQSNLWESELCRCREAVRQTRRVDLLVSFLSLIVDESINDQKDKPAKPSCSSEFRQLRAGMWMGVLEHSHVDKIC